ncbi:carboxylesterase/lipase family protein [Pelagerythrobacter sp.]|uniref:carboxylesterase/lipase family protein n=1 Tax=Pelagerythrobacter sp. TaxID=2800702 RepID=UPI0035B3B03F
MAAAAATGLAVLLAGCTTVAAPSAGAAGPIASTTSGEVGGTLDSGIAVFKGIPYAAPPVGELRWAPPAPAARWQGVKSARDFGPACVQPEVPGQSIYNDPPAEQSEDCLTLNVWSPEAARKAPVVVWIHGGSLRTGAGSAPLYDGGVYARRGVVFVSLNYRLGALGWLAHRELSAGSADEISGNYGLLDQIAALAWVRENAAAFGGDPGNVTIMGESAGALSATYLLASPRAKGLFDKAIVQSPNSRAFPELSQAANGLPSAETIGGLALRALGAENIAAARSLSAREVIDRTSAAGFPAQGTIDGKILPRQIVDTFDRGEQAQVPLIVGFNGDEVRTQRAFLPDIPEDAAEYARRIGQGYGDLAPEFLRLYPASGGEQSALDALRDGIYGWAAERLAMKQAEAGVPSYLYVFDHCYPAAEARDICGFHASEVPFTFGNFDPGDLPPRWPAPGGERDTALSNAMLDYWTSFARDGQPRSPGHAAWPAYASGQSYMLFDGTAQASRDPYPGMFELNEAFAAQRRAAGEAWGLAIGLGAAPKGEQ